jgi:predicted membrane protein
MRDRGQLLLGAAVIVIGALLLVGNILDIDVWALFWPILLILLGLGLLLRPRMIDAGATAHYELLGDFRREGAWQVADQEFWLAIGDVKLNMSEAQIPAGETRLRVWTFVSGVKLTVPRDVGVSLACSAFVTDATLFGRKRESILAPLRFESEEYAGAERKIRVELTGFVADVKLNGA